MGAADCVRFAVTIAPPKEYIHREVFREVAETVNAALLRLGFDSVLTDDIALPGRRHIVFGSNTLSWWDIEVPDDAILYNLEQIFPGTGWATDELLALFRRHIVWDYSLHNIAALRATRVNNVRHVPIGGVPELTRIPPAATRDIDVLFIGTYNDRRLAVIRRLKGMGINAQAHTAVYGTARDALYARAKIVLNIHHDHAIFEIVRVSYLLANQVFVISENCIDDEGAEFSDAVVFVDYEYIVGTCLRYLAKPAAREARIEVGREIMRSRPATEYIAAALSELPASSLDLASGLRRPTTPQRI
ncbi:hypothetical protein [Nocardia alni]|uniref:hypothetical protein n=1 Tax=Nocardia alni TaxID=2815723 RepID=UPI001C2244F9|nr:hypothetical protein [Nocardia alni]